jgi:hypothetical protein
MIMNEIKPQILPAPPNMFRALLAGFDLIANHLGLVIFSIGLDVLLWFGPQLRLREIFRVYLDNAVRVATSDTQLADAIQASQSSFLNLADRFNLATALRSFPIGVASLMVGRAPLVNPLGKLHAIEITSVPMVIVVWLGLFLIGLFIGVFLFLLVSQVVMSGQIDWAQAIRQWYGRLIQVMILTVFFLVILTAASVPISCVLPFLLGSTGLGQFVILVYGVLLFWLFFPLVLSPFGIFIHQDTMWESVKRSTRLVRATMPITLLFVLIVFVLSQGLDILWNIPADNSWFSMIGVVGHAFVATSLLAGTFIYYRDAGTYVQKRLQLISNRL